MMLEAIVENEHIGSESGQRAPANEGAIGTHQHRNAHCVGGQHQRLVAALLPTTSNQATVRHDHHGIASEATVAPADQHDLVTASMQRSRQPGRHRGLSRTPGHETPDAHDPAGNAARSAPSLPVEHPVQARDGAIGPANRQQGQQQQLEPPGFDRDL